MTATQQLKDIECLIRLLGTELSHFMDADTSARDNLAIMMASDLAAFRRICAVVFVNVAAVVDVIGGTPAGPCRELKHVFELLDKFAPMARLRDQLFACSN